MAVDGKYNIEMNSPRGVTKGTLELTSAGEALSGTYTTERGAQALTGTVNGNDVKWSITTQSPMGSMVLEFSGTLAGNEIAGKVKLGQFGEAPFKAVRA